MTTLLGSLLWLLAALGLARAAPRLARRLLPATRWPTSELFLRSVLVAACLLVVSTFLFGLCGLLARWTLLAFLAAVVLVVERLPDLRASGFPPEHRALRERLSWRGTAGPFIVTGGIVGLDTVLALPAPPTSWDAMAYHLFLPARWLEEGRIFHIPTVFFDNVAAYAPQNGALLHAWQMAISGSDATTTAAQGLMMLFGAVALYRLALELGVRRHAAAFMAPLATLLVPARHWAYTANVDVYWAAFFIGSVYWTFVYLRRGEPTSAIAAGLAAGLAAGTKTAGLVLAAAPLTVLGVTLLIRKRFALAALTGLLSIASGGFWYLRNWFLYGNPLFPLDFSIGPLHFAGVYRSEAVRQSFLNVDWPAWTLTVDVLVGRTWWIAALIGVLLLLVAARRHRRLHAMGLALFCLAWAWFCYAIQPYNNQTRFLIPALWLALLGWALILDRLPHRTLRAALGFSAVFGLFLTTTPRAAVRPRLAELLTAGADFLTLLAAAALPLLIFVLARRSKRRDLATWLAAAACWPLLISALLTCDQVRASFYAETDFKVYAPGYLMFSDPELEPQRIAYSGFSTPYVLMGSGWRHHVVYVETPIEAADGLHAYWQRDPKLYGVHKPGLYRSRDDRPGPWFERLEEERIDVVALFAPFPVERPQHWPMDGRFLIERRWLREHSNARLVAETPVAEVYRLNP